MYDMYFIWYEQFPQEDINLSIQFYQLSNILSYHIIHTVKGNLFSILNKIQPSKKHIHFLKHA